ncbi:MAG: double-strand break repair helicase AddA [Micavibrio sp.]
MTKAVNPLKSQALSSGNPVLNTGGLPDPNIAQRAASNPDVSVWVAASAGSGKTKVLTDRVLRLLLPRPDGSAGTPPEKILCLTFTKAGASEMALRINQTLSLWATMPLLTSGQDKGLSEILENLLGRAPQEPEIQAARRLFARVVDSAGGIKILTIHAFCQSLLGRFPIEAGLSPHFTVLSEDTARDLITKARDEVLRDSVRDPQSPLAQALQILAARLKDDDFYDLIQALCNERQTLKRLWQAEEQSNSLKEMIWGALSLTPDESRENILSQASADEACALTELRQATKVLCESKGKTDQKNGEVMGLWLSSTPAERITLFEDYKGVFLTQTGEIRADRGLASVAAEDTMPGIKTLMQEEAARIVAITEKIKSLYCATMTHHLLLVGQAIVSRYQDLKAAEAGLDFDDMINHTRALLTKSHMAAWVLYKLDGGLDHILVDEAQDTNPEQWEIVESLITEFFSGQSARDVKRTLFVVGDEKQSIFSFQRAAPDKFKEKHEAFKHIITQAGEIFHPVPLDVSFRSTATVLDFTDAVFADPLMRAGVSDKDIRHFSFRTGHAGHIEQWPLFKLPAEDKTKERNYWQPASQAQGSGSARTLLAHHIAHTIKEWIDKNETLPSQNRPIRPGDIMILVKSRNELVNHLIRELRNYKIDVSGLDRMKLGDHIAVQDMIAAAQFSLLPDDDLALACVLKSPLVNFNDQQLEDLALGRKGSLWQEVQDKLPALALWLSTIITKARHERPYEFFSFILQSPCPASDISGQHAMTARLSGDVIEPLHEFLTQVLSFEGEHISSLQSFILWQQNNESEIKREQDDTQNHIRIMTAHASKGLQAPIVILADTVLPTGAGGNRATDRLLWPAKTGLPFPFWAPQADDECRLYKDSKERAQQKDIEEYRRLLYVALTRAEDRLYIAGAAGKRGFNDKSWYSLTREAFTRFDNKEETPFVILPEIKTCLDLPDDACTLRLQSTQEAPAKNKEQQQNVQGLIVPDINDPAWSWVHQQAPLEEAALQPVQPSRLEILNQDELLSPSPLQSDNQYRFKRGNLTHKLLQFLPEVPLERRLETAQMFADRYGHDLPEKIRTDVVKEIMTILEHPDYATLFGPHSRAEVPVTGMSGSKLISGQIDRLVVEGQNVMIVDYKTNRPPPHTPEDVPAIYRQQLKAYADTLQNIYPAHRIRTFLLWTDGPQLMEIIL